MKLKRITALALLTTCGIGAVACASTPENEAPGASSDSASSDRASSDRPALVMLVVVDQLRSDLLDKYADFYTGGFKRLRDEGHAFTNAAHDHAGTSTAPGHATLSTGVYPSRHGIVGNLWLEQSGGNWVPVENIDDTTVKIVGFPEPRGASPIHLKRSGFAEWLVSANPRSKVASVSGKDRGAIQPAAHARSAYVYWFEGALGRFVTSTYYRTSDPAWVTAFHNDKLPQHRSETSWTLAAPASALARANPDTAANEADGVNTFFPHTFNAAAGNVPFWVWWEISPFVDALTLEMAETMVTSLELGRDDAPDFLNVSLSATDRIGHRFGPNSREQLDNLLRLDRKLGEFFDFLDRTVGKGRWTMMLSADHGVVDSPEDLRARGEYGHRLTPAESAKLDSLRARADSAQDKKAAARELVASLKKLPIVADAWTHDELARAQTDTFAILQQRSMWPGRMIGRFSRQGVEFRYRPGIYGAPRGSGHGQMYWYDRHVPMIFMGPGIRPSRDPSRAATVDFAPTFASLLGISYPRDLDGKVLKIF